MKHPNKIYIGRVFSKAAFLKSRSQIYSYELSRPREYTWPNECEGQRVYIYKGEDTSQLYVMGRDNEEYFCLYAWTEPEI